MGAAFGLLPIGWIVYWAVVLYRITLETGNFEIIKDSIGGLTTDRRLQAMLIAFAFGAFIEGAAGFGTPVAVAAAMLTGLGFSPFFAAGICLLANTAPVAFGSIGIPVVTLAGTTGIDELDAVAWVGRICAPVSVFIPAYLILVMGGFRGLKGVLPAAIVCGVCFASVQFLVSNFIGPQLVDIMAALDGDHRPRRAAQGLAAEGQLRAGRRARRRRGAEAARLRPHAARLVAVPVPRRVRARLGLRPVEARARDDEHRVRVAGLAQRDHAHGADGRATPHRTPRTTRSIGSQPPARPARSRRSPSASLLRVSVGMYIGILGRVLKQLAFSLLTIACVLGLAYLMNYSGAVVTLGLAFAATGALFPFFSALLGWLGVFLTGSDTSANALFGNLQVVTANSLGLRSRDHGGVELRGRRDGQDDQPAEPRRRRRGDGHGARREEGKLFRFTVKHSVFLAAVLGVIATIYAYAA